MNISKSAVITLLITKQCDKFGEHNNNEIWLTKEKFIIRLPLTSTIPADIVEIIALDILRIGMWEYDYWLGRHCIN